jgi:carbamate kinase
MRVAFKYSMRASADSSGRVVLVLGGNAFARRDAPLTMQGQFEFAESALAQITPLLDRDVRLLVSHGNGPQVGSMLARVEASVTSVYALPLSVCVAETEGELGYVLAQTLHNLFRARGIDRPIATLLTQTEVDPNDPAFRSPTKPIGPVLDAAAAERLRRMGATVCEDVGRGLRRTVASPEPLAVVELSIIERLLSAGVVVIAAGGGGVPVVRRDGGLHGVEAVIDKDLAAAQLGADLGADRLVILTDVPCAYLHFRSTRETPLGRVRASEVRARLAEGHFAVGSMAPKMEAAARFASRRGCSAVVCDPPSLQAALRGEAGTTVVPD